ncbi:MAG: NAD(P)-dependent oxidoreductase [Chloroflexi bacterium]|nr:NAD(P)-dependent oxidoreductase [Chloroflexota bacterium]OJV99212.1 MAG: 6-phosphogluconate dehydrogenase [Chloroflexi bacterium 54-19]
MTEKIGFIGLGLLGLPMAANLQEAGYSLVVYNRTAAKAEPLVAKGAELAPTIIEAVQPGGITISILWNDTALEEVVTEEFLEKLGPGGIHVSMATVLPETARKMAQLHADHGCVFVEATVFGRPEAAAARQLNIPYAGPKAAKEKIKPLLEAMGGQGVFDFGETYGAANIVKLVGNYLIFAASQSMREALTLSARYGVDPHPVVNMLTTTLFAAPIYQSYGQRIAEGNFTSAASPIPLKDIALFKTTAGEVEMPTPIADLLEDLMKQEAANSR